MTWHIPSELLCGLNSDQASCLGMPHQGAEYLNGTGDAHRLIDGIHCVSCRVNPASNAHHEPIKGMGGRKTLMLHGKLLRPSLHALCGMGNASGCHGMRHAGKLTILWVWNDDESKRAWWEGELFREGYEPHDPRLYDLGRWEHEFKKTGSGKTVRGPFSSVH